MNWLEKMGVELPILKWTESRAATRLNWQRENWPECKKLTALFCKFGIAIGLPVLVATKIWFPEGFVPAIIGNLVVLWFCCLLPVIAFLQVWALSKAGIVCARVLFLKVHDRRGEQCERQFCFDPNEVREIQIRALIEPHLARKSPHNES